MTRRVRHSRSRHFNPGALKVHLLDDDDEMVYLLAGCENFGELACGVG